MSNRIAVIAEPQRHPFREGLHLRDQRNTLRSRVRATDQDNDWKLFVLSFSAFFVCFYTFIA